MIYTPLPTPTVIAEAYSPSTSAPTIHTACYTPAGPEYTTTAPAPAPTTASATSEYAGMEEVTPSASQSKSDKEFVVKNDAGDSSIGHAVMFSCIGLGLVILVIGFVFLRHQNQKRHRSSSTDIATPVHDPEIATEEPNEFLSTLNTSVFAMSTRSAFSEYSMSDYGSEDDAHEFQLTSEFQETESRPFASPVSSVYRPTNSTSFSDVRTTDASNLTDLTESDFSSNDEWSGDQYI